MYVEPGTVWSDICLSFHHMDGVFNVWLVSTCRPGDEGLHGYRLPFHSLALCTLMQDWCPRPFPRVLSSAC